MPGLQGWYYTDEIANAAKVILNREGPTKGHLSGAANAVNAFNNLYRGMRATLDLSYLGVQGLLPLGKSPKAYRKAMMVAFKAWGKNGDKILAKYILDFDKQAGATDRVSSHDWAKAGLHLAGEETEFKIGQGKGIGHAIGNLPGPKQANRAFGYFGDAVRLSWADAELETLMAKRSLADIKKSGDIELIAKSANMMTGRVRGKTMGSIGDLILFAPKWLESRLETVAKAAAGMRPNAPLDQRLARGTLLRLIGYGALLTFAVNAWLGNETDYRPVIRDGKAKTGWKRNSDFMRISFEGHKYNLFGSGDSLLGLFINIGTLHPLRAMRSMSSGAVSLGWDLITGRDYDYNDILKNPLEFLKWLIGSFVPFSYDQMIPDAKQIYEGALMEPPDAKRIIGGTVNIGSQLIGVKGYQSDSSSSYTPPPLPESSSGAKSGSRLVAPPPRKKLAPVTPAGER
jgi:hypothetical protein